jgi:phosphoserine aminotransferase
LNLQRVISWFQAFAFKRVHSYRYNMTANETINGLEFHSDPELPAGAPPLVADFTSTLLSRPVDFSKYGVVYASTGKNLGPSGLVVAILRKDLLTDDGYGVNDPSTTSTSKSCELPVCPGVMSFRAAAKKAPIANLWNTPNVFGIRALQLVLEDTKAKGGVAEMQRRARRRAGAFYDVIDGSDGFYTNHVEPQWRSLMTIPLRIMDGDRALEEKFIRESTEAGFYNLVGHPLFGGLRVTVYNQLEDEAVDALVGFLRDFARRETAAAKAAVKEQQDAAALAELRAIAAPQPSYPCGPVHPSAYDMEMYDTRAPTPPIMVSA